MESLNYLSKLKASEVSWSASYRLGELVDDTKQEIKKPRCEVLDVDVNGRRKKEIRFDKHIAFPL